MKYTNNDQFKVKGKNRLFGTIENQTSKNAILPIMSASIMAEGITTLNKCPDLLDVDSMSNILIGLGAKIVRAENCMQIDSSQVTCSSVNSELGKKLRSSLFLLGSALAKFKSATISMPGGCRIGSRPIDIHIDALKNLGVKVGEIGDFLFFDASNARAKEIKLKLPSVGATENLVQFASTLEGKTIIHNAAKEPEVEDLCNFLSAMGADIEGAGTNHITICGVNSLKPIEYTPIPDRIVAGTIMVATAITGGRIKITKARADHNQNLIDKLSRTGCQIEIKNDIITLTSADRPVALRKIKTGYYPEFPTDLQSLMLALSAVSDGETYVNEKVFENRFLTVGEYRKMGALIENINPHVVKVTGVADLNAANMRAMDLRGGAGLVLAALNAKGESLIDDVYHIDRGYDHLENMLTSLGADITRI